MFRGFYPIVIPELVIRVCLRVKAYILANYYLTINK